MRGLTLSLIAASAIAGFAMAASAQSQQAGVSAAVQGQVALARVSENVVGRQVQSGDPIFLGDAITSGRESGLQIMLLDETVFTVGPNSEISIDEFVYDPATDSGKVVASVAKGAFRFITGKIARKRPEDMTVRLPTATIGIRGTIVAGVVRGAPGDDPAADEVFNQLKKDSPGAENARDFVVLLGPGDENNTNDKGGAFVFAPNLPQQAVRGRSAGAQAPQPRGLTGPGSPGYGTNFPGFDPIRVSRTGSAAVGFEDGDPQGPFFVSDFARLFSRLFPANIQGTASANDPAAQDANNAASDPDNLSGNSIADAAAEGALTDGLAQIGNELSDNLCNTCSTPGAFELTQFQTGFAQSSGALSLGVFSIGNHSISANLADQTLTFDFQSINGGGLSSAQIGCFSGCSIDYGARGSASFSEADANIITNCSSCTLSGVITAIDSASVTLTHDGNVGSSTVPLSP